MSLSSTDLLTLFPFDGSFVDEEAFSRSQSPLSDLHSLLLIASDYFDFGNQLLYYALQLQDPYLRCDRDLK